VALKRALLAKMSVVEGGMVKVMVHSKVVRLSEAICPSRLLPQRARHRGSGCPSPPAQNQVCSIPATSSTSRTA
jgi:hypothetical protein